MSFHLLTNLKSRPMLEAYDVYFGQFMALMEKSRQEKINSRIKVYTYQMLKSNLGRELFFFCKT